MSVVVFPRVDDACEETFVKLENRSDYGPHSRIEPELSPKMRCRVPLTVFVLCVFGHVSAQEAEITPAIGLKGTRCYDKFNKAQVREASRPLNFTM